MMEAQQHTPQMPGWLTAFLDLLLDIAAPIIIALILICATPFWLACRLIDLLRVLGAAFGCYILEMWRESTREPAPQPSRRRGIVTIPRQEPAELVEPLPRFLRNPSPPVITVGEARRKNEAQRKQDFIANEKKVEAARAADKEKREQELRKRYPSLFPPKFTYQEIWEAEQKFFKGMAEVRRNQGGWKNGLPTPTKPAGLGPARVGQVCKMIERLSHHKWHWMFSESSDRQVLFKDAQLSPGYLSSRQIGERYFGRRKQTHFWQLIEVANHYSFSSSSAAHQKTVAAYRDYLQNAQNGQGFGARQNARQPQSQLFNWSATSFSTSWESAENLKIAAAHGHLFREAPRDGYQGHGPQLGSNEYTSSGANNGTNTSSGEFSGNFNSNERPQEKSTGAASGAASTPVDDQRPSVFDRLAPADPPKSTFTTAQWQGFKLNLSNNDGGAASAGATNPSATNIAPATNPFTSNTGAATKPLAANTGAGQASSAIGGNYTFGGTRHGDTRPRARGPINMAVSPRNKAAGANASTAQGAVSNPAASHPRSATPSSSWSAAPPLNPILAQADDNAKRGLIKMWTTGMISTFSNKSFREMNGTQRNEVLQLIRQRLTWILEWCAPDDLNWDESRVNLRQAKDVKLTERDLAVVSNTLSLVATKSLSGTLQSAARAADLSLTLLKSLCPS